MDLLHVGARASPTARRSSRSSSSSPSEVEPRHGITIRAHARRSLRRDMDRFAEVYNAAWSANWGFVPLPQEGPRRLRPGDAARLRPQLVHGRRDRRGGDRRVGDHGPRHQPGADEDERPAAAARLVALPAQAARRSTACGSASSASSPSTSTRASPRRSTSSTSTPPARTPQKWGEMGWILETNTNMNRAMEAMGGRDRAALPGLRARALVRG